MAAAAIAAAVLIVVSLAPWQSDGEVTSSEIILPTPRPGDIPRQGSTLGNPNAPLTVVEYSDFLCPVCTRAALEVVPRMEEEFVATGKVKLIFKQFPIAALHGEAAVVAAEAAECAAEQDAFWEYHDILYLNSGRVPFTVENLKLFAGEVGLDGTAFGVCLDEGRYQDKVAADYDEAQRRGATGTPAFFVGTTMVTGISSTNPWGSFKDVIEDELAKLGETGETE